MTNLPVHKAEPRLFNSSWLGVQENFSLDEVFNKLKCLGLYSRVHIHWNLKNYQIVFDSNELQNLNQNIKSLGYESNDLSFQEVFNVCKALEAKIYGILPVHLFKSANYSLDLEGSENLLYLDEILSNNKLRGICLPIIAQYLFENYSKYETRLVNLKISEQDSSKNAICLLVKMSDDEIRIFDPCDRVPPIHDLEMNYSYQRFELSKQFELSLKQDELQVYSPEYKWSEKDRRLSLFAANGQEIPFQVLGRSPFEKRCKRQAKEIKEADENQLVPVEIAFHPYWRRLGHTTLRIGTSLYELSSEGWRVHSNGADNARAYIYNNPFFKAQYEKFKDAGMPPLSMAVTLCMPKQNVIQLWATLENLVAARGKKREKFSLFLNNCNQGLMRVLEEAGLKGFEKSGYRGFSSVLSFRKTLLKSQFPVEGYYIYPLPGTKIEEQSLKRWIPKLVYRHNCTLREVFRAIPSLGLDAILTLVNRINEVISKIYRKRAYRERRAYHM